MTGYFFSDEETQAGMQRISDQYNYVACPHTAIGIMGMQRYLNKTNNEVQGVALATAHPAKFKPLVEEILIRPVDVPDRLAILADRPKQSIRIPANYDAFRESLLQHL